MKTANLNFAENVTNFFLVTIPGSFLKIDLSIRVVALAALYTLAASYGIYKLATYLFAPTVTEKKPDPDQGGGSPSSDIKSNQPAPLEKEKQTQGYGNNTDLTTLNTSLTNIPQLDDPNKGKEPLDPSLDPSKEKGGVKKLIGKVVDKVERGMQRLSQGRDSKNKE